MLYYDTVFWGFFRRKHLDTVDKKPLITTAQEVHGPHRSFEKQFLAIN